MNQSKCDEAIKAFDKTIEIDPQYVEAWAWKGWAFYGSSSYNEALKAYGRAIGLDPMYADAWVGKGIVLIMQGKDDESRKALDKAKELRYTKPRSK